MRSERDIKRTPKRAPTDSNPADKPADAAPATPVHSGVKVSYAAPREWSDRPRHDRDDRGPGPRRDGERPQGDRPRGDRPYGDRPQGERGFSDRPRGDRPPGDRPYGDRPRGDRPFGDRPFGDRPFGDRPPGDRPFGDRPRGDRPQGERGFSDRPRSDRPQGDRPFNDRPFGDRPRNDRPFNDRPRGDGPRGPFGPREGFARDERSVGSRDERGPREVRDPYQRDARGPYERDSRGPRGDARPGRDRLDTRPGERLADRGRPDERGPRPERQERAERGERPAVTRVPRPDGEAPRRAPAPTRPPEDGVRLSKVLSDRGLASRREADDWIDAGWVKVNGQMAVLGQRVQPTDQIEVEPAAHSQQAQRVTILLNKPIGYVSGQAEDGYEPASVLVRPENHWAEDPSKKAFHPGHARHLAPAGRLDIDSTGLLVLTQDGRIAKHLIGENSDVEKEYLVRVEPVVEGQALSEENLARLNHGLELDGVTLKPAKVSWANEDQLRFVLREGRKRQVRRMCELVGLKVTALKRVRIGSVVLGKLPPGQWRYLRFDERF